MTDFVVPTNENYGDLYHPSDKQSADIAREALELIRERMVRSADGRELCAGCAMDILKAMRQELINTAREDVPTLDEQDADDALDLGELFNAIIGNTSRKAAHA